MFLIENIAQVVLIGCYYFYLNNFLNDSKQKALKLLLNFYKIGHVLYFDCTPNFKTENLIITL